MKKSYKGDIAKRFSINLSPDDLARLEYVHEELRTHFGLSKPEEPSASLILTTVLKRLVESDKDFLPGLHAELLAASKTKNPRAARIALYQPAHE